MVLLSSLTMHTVVPLFVTWKTFLKNLFCTGCILSICFLVSPIQLSQFERILDDIFDLNYSTGAFATLCPSSAGWFIVSMIISALSIAEGILPSRVAVMLASHPSSWI